MDLRARAQHAVEQACDALSAELSEADMQQVTSIIEAAMRDAVEAASAESRKVVSACCDADQDMAHKISAEIKRANTALVANLQGLR
ncbi:MAG: hypothetical protein QNJ30_05455 [Kiloniellales bacterium]|nr:hypothetical protein [Kiloniellales bacterium]